MYQIPQSMRKKIYATYYIGEVNGKDKYSEPIELYVQTEDIKSLVVRGGFGVVNDYDRYILVPIGENTRYINEQSLFQQSGCRTPTNVAGLKLFPSHSIENNRCSTPTNVAGLKPKSGCICHQPRFTTPTNVESGEMTIKFRKTKTHQILMCFFGGCDIINLST